MSVTLSPLPPLPLPLPLPVPQGIVKCNQYWPESVNIPRLYGDIKVTMTEEEELAVYCVRKFSVQEVSLCVKVTPGVVCHPTRPLPHPHPVQYGNEDSTRHVQQFHFLAWPDHGVPDYPTDILTFHQCVRNYHSRCGTANPMVVHCSAGVGRTGTFVTLDTCIQMMETESKVDVFNFVRNLRWRRNYMVQTEVGGRASEKGVVVCSRAVRTAANPAPSPVSPLQSQFVFIYDALAEFHSCGDTSIAARDLGKELKRLESSGDKGQNGYQQQFEVSGWGWGGTMARDLVQTTHHLYLHRNSRLSVLRRTQWSSLLQKTLPTRGRTALPLPFPVSAS